MLRAELTPMWMLAILRWCIVHTVPQFQRINSLLSVLILLSKVDSHNWFDCPIAQYLAFEGNLKFDHSPP